MSVRSGPNRIFDPFYIEDEKIDKNDWNNIKKYVKRVQYYLLEENY